MVAIGAGGLGLIGVQLLRALTPAEVIVVEPREESRALATEVGAHHRGGGRHADPGGSGSHGRSTLEIITKELLIVGNAAGTYDDLADLATLTAQGAVTLHTTPYPPEAVNDALQDLEQGRVQGRAVLVPG